MPLPLSFRDNRWLVEASMHEFGAETTAVPGVDTRVHVAEIVRDFQRVSK